MWTVNTGVAKGTLALRFSGVMQAEDVLRFHPEIQAQLNEILRRGWKYLFIEIRGTAVSEAEFQELPCLIRPIATSGSRAAPPSYGVEVNFGRQLPELKGIPEVEDFRVNVCSKSFPRAATIDLVKGTVTYLHDAFWKWEKGWAADAARLSEAKEVFEIATWLVDVKKLALVDPFDPARYRQLAEEFKAKLE